jgi:hypothetical protein
MFENISAVLQRTTRIDNTFIVWFWVLMDYGMTFF